VNISVVLVLNALCDEGDTSQQQLYLTFVVDVAVVASPVLIAS
jgi:hypothetical protein